jgi:hypothetical protein
MRLNFSNDGMTSPFFSLKGDWEAPSLIHKFTLVNFFNLTYDLIHLLLFKPNLYLSTTFYLQKVILNSIYMKLDNIWSNEVSL